MPSSAYKNSNHPCPKFVSVQIRYFRKSKGHTQKSLSEASGVKMRHLQKIEAGGVDMKLSTFGAIARALGITPDVLLFPVSDNIQLMCTGCKRNRRFLEAGNSAD